VMPVPNSPHLYRRAIPVEPPPEEEEEEGRERKPPTKTRYSTKYEQLGRQTVSGVEAFLGEEGSAGRAGRRSSAAGPASGQHRSRERTRQSAVQRLVERKLAQKLKEREREREVSWTGLGQHCSQRSGAALHGRDRSATRSESGFCLGPGRASSPCKENVCPEQGGGWRARSVSASRFSRAASAGTVDTAKTYITIGPGKPTRIREHSPSKSAKLSTDETVTSARERSAQSRNTSPLKVFDLNRSKSPSPQRKTREHPSVDADNELQNRSTEKKKEFLRNTSPLKSTNILKTFRASKEENILKDFNSRPQRKSCQAFTTEKTFLVNQTNNNNNNSNTNKNKNKNCESSKPERRLSIEILDSCYKEDREARRTSPESSCSLSSLSSPLSSSTDSVESGGEKAGVHLSQRRISLEQRLQARQRLPSPERVTVTRRVSEVRTSVTGAATATTTATTTQFLFRKTSTSSSSGGATQQRPNNLPTGPAKPVPASRKISLPQSAARRPEPAPRRRSLSWIISPERWAVATLVRAWLILGKVTDCARIIYLGHQLYLISLLTNTVPVSI